MRGDRLTTPSTGGRSSGDAGQVGLVRAMGRPYSSGRRAGLNSSADADALKIDVNMCGVRANCGAFHDVDPKTVDMGTGPALSDTEQ